MVIIGYGLDSFLYPLGYERRAAPGEARVEDDDVEQRLREHQGRDDLHAAHVRAEQVDVNGMHDDVKTCSQNGVPLIRLAAHRL